jgi:hypothetical protein
VAVGRIRIAAGAEDAAHETAGHAGGCTRGGAAPNFAVPDRAARRARRAADRGVLGRAARDLA